MTVDQLRSLYDSQPVRPFFIHLADGREIFVSHREFLSFAPSGRSLTVYQPDDSFNIIDSMLVTSLEVRPSAPSATSNGK